MKIISGGQTGADRAGLDAAIALGLDYGGAIPRGRRTENGPLPPKYDRMTELDSFAYPDRTRRNVLDSDATVIFTRGPIAGGSELTLRLAEEHKKPRLHLNLNSRSEEEAVRAAGAWLRKIRPEVLNIAGSREPKNNGVYRKVYRILLRVLKDYRKTGAN